MDEGDEDAERDAEHGAAGSAEIGGRFAIVVEGFLALLAEGDDFGQKDDVFAVEFHAGGVDLEAVVVAVEAGVEGVHGVHFALFGGGVCGAFGFEGVLGAAERGAFVEGSELLLVELGEGVVDFAGCFFVLEDGVDGETEGDDFDGQEAGNEPGRAVCEQRSTFTFHRIPGWAYHIAGIQYLLTGANLSLYIAASHTGAPGSLTRLAPSFNE